MAPTLLRCANCKSYINEQELQLRKPPLHPWRLTADGERWAAELAARGGDHPACPECGNRTLLPRDTPLH